MLRKLIFTTVIWAGYLCLPVAARSQTPADQENNAEEAGRADQGPSSSAPAAAPSVEPTENAPAGNAEVDLSAGTTPGSVGRPGNSGDTNDRWVLGLRASEAYRFRHATTPTLAEAQGEMPSAETDHDVQLFIGVNLQDPGDRFFADAALGAWIDLDGVPSASHGAALVSPYDESGPFWLDVFSLYGEYRGPGAFALARVGRQQADHGRPATFDGAAIRFRLVDRYLELFAFGGRTIHFFNTDDGYFEDFLGSAGVVVRPASFLRFELDYRFLREDTHEWASDEERSAVQNHSYGIQGWLFNGDWLYLRAHLRGLGDRFSRVGGAAMLTWDELQLGLDIRGELQLIAFDEVNERDDPYYSILGHSRPNVRLHADLWKRFETDSGAYTIHAGWNARILALNTPTPFNRDFGRVYALLQAAEVGGTGLFAGATVAYHYTHSSTDGSDDSIFSLGGSLGWDGRLLKFEVGTYYSQVKYTYYKTAEERENVRTYFGEIGYRLLDWLQLKGRYEFERFDRDIHQATISLAQTY